MLIEGNADQFGCVGRVGLFRLAAGFKWVACISFEDKGLSRLTCFSHLFQSDPVKGVLLLPVLPGVVSNGNGEEVLWDYSAYVRTCYINMISLSHIAYFFPSPRKTIEKKSTETKYSGLYHWLLVGGP